MTTQQTENQKLRPRYIRLFTIIAIGLVIISGIHISSILTSGPTSENIADSIYHFVAALGFFGVSRLVKSGKRAVIYLLGVIGVFAISYSMFMDRGFNPIMILIIATFIWQMLSLSKNGELA